MKPHTFLSIAILSLSSMMAFSAFADGQGNISVKSEVFKVVEEKQADGTVKTKLLRPEETKMLPKDTVTYINSINNVSDEAVEKIVVSNPIAKEVTYIAGSATGDGAEVTFSIDNGKSYASPDALKIKGEDGQERLAEPSEYTHIQWKILPSLAPGSTTLVSFKAKIGKEE